MPSIRWIRNAIIDGHPAMLEIMVGVERIGDRCYVRMDREPEQWFRASGDTREAVVAQGIAILKNRLVGHLVLNADGSDFHWD